MLPNKESSIVLGRYDEEAEGSFWSKSRDQTVVENAAKIKTENEPMVAGTCNDETCSDVQLERPTTNGKGTAVDKVNSREQLITPHTDVCVKIESNDEDKSTVTRVLVTPMSSDLGDGKTHCTNAESFFKNSPTTNKETEAKETRCDQINILQTDKQVELKKLEVEEGYITNELVGLFPFNLGDCKTHQVDSDDPTIDLSATNIETEVGEVKNHNRLNISQSSSRISVDELKEEKYLTRDLVIRLFRDIDNSKTHQVDAHEFESFEDSFADSKITQPEKTRDSGQLNIPQINPEVKIEKQEEVKDYVARALVDTLPPDLDDSKTHWTNGGDLPKNLSASNKAARAEIVRNSDQLNIPQTDLPVKVEEEDGEKSHVTRELINPLSPDDDKTHQTKRAGSSKNSYAYDKETISEHGRDRNQLNILQTDVRVKTENNKEQKSQATKELIVCLSRDVGDRKADWFSLGHPSKDSLANNKGIRAEEVRESCQQNTSQINTGVKIEEQVEGKGQITEELNMYLSRGVNDHKKHQTDAQDPLESLSLNNKDSRVEEIRDRSQLITQKSNSPFKVEVSEEEKILITQKLVAPSRSTDDSKCDSKALLRTVKCEESETRIEDKQLSNLDQFSCSGRDNVCSKVTGEKSFELSEMQRKVLPNFSCVELANVTVTLNDLFPKNFVGGTKEVQLRTDESCTCVYSRGKFKVLTKGPANSVCSDSLSSARPSCSRKKGKIENPKKFMFLCMSCPYKFECASSLKKHCTMSHGHRNRNSCQHATGSFSLNHPIVQNCSETHRKKKEFMQTKKCPSKISQKTSKRSYCCLSCPYKGHSKHLLKAHLRIHSSKKPYKCEKCLMKFRSKGELNRHMITHTSERLLKCAHCAASFKLKGCLINHLKTHSDERSYSCTECPAKVKTRQGLTIHLETHSSERRFECAHCSHRFKSKIAIRIHVKSHFDERPYSCTQCWAKFKGSGALKCHLRAKHSSERPFECSHCSSRFKTRGTLKVHLITHSDERPFQCPQCPSAFRQKTHLKTHLIAKHTGDRLYTCGHCSAKFKQKHLLARHLMTHSDEKPHQCPQCHMTFRRKETLKAHLRRHSGDTGDKPYSCPQCPANFRVGSQLKRHLASHSEERPYFCDQCPTKFKRKDTLKEHIQEVHIGTKKRHACSQCPFRTHRVYQLKKHLSVHSDEKPFSCDKCHAKFKALGSLKRHAKLHTSRVFSCDRCSKTFMYKSILQVHLTRLCVKNGYACSKCPFKFPSLVSLRTHSGVHADEGKYTCEQCLAKFTQKGHVKTHILTVHMGEKPHACWCCPRSFTSKLSLLNHLKNHSSKKSDE